MDPNISSDEFGQTPDAPQSATGASYLRRLKAEAGSGESVAGTSAPASAVSKTPAFAGSERRRVPRYRCTGSAEFKAEGTDVRMWGALTDVSLHGCYVEMSTTFPVGTKVDLTLEAMGIRFHALGLVRVSYPFLGMGISLTEIDPGQQVQLEQLLSVLSGHDAIPAPAPPSTSTLEIVSAAEPLALLDGIRHFFDSNRTMTQQEFVEIAKRCRRNT